MAVDAQNNELAIGDKVIFVAIVTNLFDSDALPDTITVESFLSLPDGTKFPISGIKSTVLTKVSP